MSVRPVVGTNSKVQPGKSVEPAPGVFHVHLAFPESRQMLGQCTRPGGGNGIWYALNAIKLCILPWFGYVFMKLVSYKLQTHTLICSQCLTRWTFEKCRLHP